jgi:hypothetical protein
MLLNERAWSCYSRQMTGQPLGKCDIHLSFSNGHPARRTCTLWSSSREEKFLQACRTPGGLPFMCDWFWNAFIFPLCTNGFKMVSSFQDVPTVVVWNFICFTISKFHYFHCSKMGSNNAYDPSSHFPANINCKSKSNAWPHSYSDHSYSNPSSQSLQSFVALPYKQLRRSTTLVQIIRTSPNRNFSSLQTVCSLR